MTKSPLAQAAVRAATLVAIAAAATTAVSCSSSGGGGRGAPDEFRVVTRAPLELPPDYALRPPRPGEPRPQELQPNEEARTALFGQDLGQNASAGERSLVARAGAETTDATIRDTVDFEGANIVHRDQNFADRLIQFQGAEADAANPNITAEQRTAEQEANRRVTGGAAVTIERRETGFKLPGT